jgi:hypothetical protein
MRKVRWTIYWMISLVLCSFGSFVYGKQVTNKFWRRYEGALLHRVDVQNATIAQCKSNSALNQH